MLKGFLGKRICVAVSGGVDSVSLLHYLKGQETTYGYTLCAVHCEHGIRGEDSLHDARFVETLCKQWEVSLYTFAENCPLRAERDKQSLETAARAFRIECFQRLLAEEKAEATAKRRREDQVEKNDPKRMHGKDLLSKIQSDGCRYKRYQKVTTK